MGSTLNGECKYSRFTKMVDFCWEKAFNAFIGLNFTLPKLYNLGEFPNWTCISKTQSTEPIFPHQESLFSVPVSCLAGWRVREKRRWRCLAIGQDLWRSFFSFVPCRRHFEMLLIRGFPLRLGRRLPLLRELLSLFQSRAKMETGTFFHLYEMISKRVKYLLRQINLSGEKNRTEVEGVTYFNAFNNYKPDLFLYRTTIIRFKKFFRLYFLFINYLPMKNASGYGDKWQLSPC